MTMTDSHACFLQALSDIEDRDKRIAELEAKVSVAERDHQYDAQRWRQEFNILEAKCDKMVENSVGALMIAEGREGWEAIPLDCPTLGAVAALRTKCSALEAHLRAMLGDADAYFRNNTEWLRCPWITANKARAALASQPPEGKAKLPPYPEFCRHPDKCAGLGSCPRDPCCCD